MEIRPRSFNFPRSAGSGPQTAEAVITFARRVLRATVGMAGYSATYEKREDHHLGRLTVELGSRINPDDDTQVIVSGAFGLRDWSGEWDDDYAGNIEYVVLADLEGATPPLPGDARGDLLVADAEITQVIQHFRSDQHLDSINVFPDNSIRLVADKPTAVRLYIDYDRNSGLAVIGTLSGRLEVIRGAATETLTPLNSITPRRDAQIDRGQRQHTLNFVIPETSSRGDVTIRATVFDAADPSQFSQTFERTLAFETIPALPLMAVGINYTGPDVTDDATPATLAAPTEADFINTLALTEQLFPTPQVSISSFVTMDYDGEVESDINDGCDKMDDLLDAVRDLRGDSEDIVIGLFNTGLNTGSVGGCGGGGGAVGRVNNGGTAAHELGHALGRQHAPCDNVTRCATPANTDDGYPRYSGYDSDSIGEFGFNTNDGMVKDPGNAHDLMGYSGNRWISPYTYKALLSRIPETFAASASASLEASSVRNRADDHGDWIKRKQPHLFLNLVIDRMHKVTLKPAFHFLAYPQARGHMRTDYTIELQDEQGKMLKHACLYAAGHGAACGCEHGVWPLRFRQAMSFDARATRLVIFHCDDAIYEQAIPKAPELKLEVREGDNAHKPALHLRWQAHGCDGDAPTLWYLVQWRDARGTWRGCAGRTRATALTVPKSVFRRQRQIALRVLASSGIATGQAIWEGPLEQPQTPPEEVVQLRLQGVGAAGGAFHTGPVLRVAAVGSTLAGTQLRWYDSRGTEIGSGRSFDLRALRPGFHLLSVRMADRGNGGGTASWRVEITRAGKYLVHLPKQQTFDTKE
jgi:hypothetical protein